MSNTTASGEPIIPAGCAQNTECLEEYGEFDYIPTLPGNALFLAIFALALIAQVLLGIRHRTWGYMSAMIGGCILEIVGYAGRLMLHDDIFNNNSFIIYIVGLTIGPAFYSAALYLCMSRIVAIYGTSLPLVKARTMTIVFIGGDFISLLLQSAGGAIASTADDQEGSDMGVNIMIAGLAVQVVVTSFFLAACLHLMWAIRKYPHKVIAETSVFRKTFAFRFFLYAIGISTIAILIRCTFRCAELSGGFDGELANDEITFMILDGTMMVVTVILLTVAHPGLTLGDRWNDGAFFQKKDRAVYKMADKSGEGSNESLRGSRYGSNV